MGNVDGGADLDIITGLKDDKLAIEFDTLFSARSGYSRQRDIFDLNIFVAPFVEKLHSSNLYRISAILSGFLTDFAIGLQGEFLKDRNKAQYINVPLL